jgi:hypothetical protein
MELPEEVVAQLLAVGAQHHHSHHHTVDEGEGVGQHAAHGEQEQAKEQQHVGDECALTPSISISNSGCLRLALELSLSWTGSLQEG